MTHPLAARIDHTLLRPDAAEADIRQLCEEALAWRFAAVCTNSRWTPLVAALLARSGVAVCAVAGFPFGASYPELEWLTLGRSFGVPHSFFAMLLVAVIAWVVLQMMVGFLAGGQGVLLATPAHVGGFLAGLLLQRPLLLWRYRSA